MNLLIKRTENAKDLPLPKYQSELAAGFDLHANIDNDIIIKPKEFKNLMAGICVEIPKGYEGQVRGRSGNAFKYGIGITHGTGTVDADFRAEVGVTLVNNGSEDFVIKRGDRIAQMIIAKVEQPTIVEVDELSETIRGEGGFGSTGK